MTRKAGSAQPATASAQPATANPQAALIERLRLVLAERQAVREVRMFGSVAFMVDEKMAVAAGRGGDLLVRVAPARYEALLARGAEAAFMGPDRPMGQGWLSVPRQHLEDDQDLRFWVEVGIDSRSSPR